MPLLSAAKKERPARQLADVEHIPREQEPLAEDRCQHIRVLAGAHRSEEHDLRFVPEPLRERGSRSLQRQRRRSRTVTAERITFEIPGGDPHVGRHEAIRHGDDVDPVPPCLRRARKGACVLQLPSKVEAAEEAEDIPERNSFLAQLARKGGVGTRPS
jgi:hypothetical protein